MPTFLYRCPNTGLRVQGWISDDPTEQDDDSFETVTCPACGCIHLVNPKTGKVLGGLAEQTAAKPGVPGQNYRHGAEPPRRYRVRPTRPLETAA